MKHTPHALQTIAILAVTQILSWGSLYYAIAILAPEIQKEMGWRAELVFGAFSWSLLVAGMIATYSGMLLDRHGGRLVMGMGSATCGLGLILLSSAHTLPIYFLAWSILGLAMAMTLYEAAFATITHHFTIHSRQAISTLTLFGGFASTVFWPLTQKLNSMIGWRDTYLAYGIAQLLVCLPLHLLLQKKRAVPHVEIAKAKTAPDTQRSHSLQEALRNPTFWKLAFAFSANSFVFSALSVHLIPLLGQVGHPVTLAVFMAALIGPMQVAGRIGEMTLARNALPQTVGKFTFAALPAALLTLILFGTHAWAIALFCVFYGLSNGILTIVRGTIPQALFGTKNYGAISGAMSGPALFSKAAGPLIIASLVQHASSPDVIFACLLLFSIASLAFYLAALKTR
ncbi:MFS transporter [Undibacterium sp. CY18W]|uniref:MFS transporter n=1 Tax=Undibacterium hunanense TaxID=2762292 RepID=A0ABR6ZUX8_9BURK|nr:MFS transporter [Undibacterium hunanense]MBC3919320.1 MFS transporter [Undibacterium hunanense]